MATKYQIGTASTATGVGLGDILVATPGTIYAVVMRYRGTGGAGIGYYSGELTVNNGANSFSETNNPIKGYAVASFCWGFPNAGIGVNTYAPVPVSVKIRSGDRLFWNQSQSGTAAAAQLVAIDIYVNE